MGDILSNLEAWYKFDEGSGTTATDSSGNGRDGTLNNGATYTTGQIGAFALLLDGVNDWVQPGAMPASGTTYTIAFWVKPNATSDAVIFMNSGSGIGLYWIGGKPDLFSNGHHVSNTAPTNAVWSHIVVSVSSGSVAFYLNGAADGTGTTATTSFTPNEIGADGSGSASQFKGNLDDFRYYSRALSAGDVTDLFAYTGVASDTLMAQICL